jgi:chorismate mutase/prephenate dehydratase
VHHHLLSTDGRLESIRKVLSHPQSFAQCRKWLDARLPKAEREPVSSNGQAARDAKEQGKGVAAIASLQAGQINGLNILASNIEDDPNNTTRFLVIGKHDPQSTGDDITSIVMSGHRNQPGALFRLLQPFSDAKLDLTRIESRPIKGSAVPDYYFFIDFAGHVSAELVRTALEQVRTNAAFFKILGSYPRAVV